MDNNQQNNPFKHLRQPTDTPSENLGQSVVGSYRSINNILKIFELFLGNMSRSLVSFLQMNDGQPQDDSNNEDIPPSA